MVKQKKIPMRMCVACREMKPKRELTRVVKSKENAISIDRTGKAPGRGAYLCMQPDCLKKAMKSKALDRALEISIDPAVYEQLARFIEEAAQDE